MNRFTAGLFASLILFPCTLALAQNAVVNDVMQKMNAGQYPDALQAIAKTLSTTPQPGDAGNRYTLLMLKGECLMRTNSFALAADAFDSAAYIATDPRDRALGRANAMLIRASSAGKYKSKQTGDSIDIVNADSRKQAFTALRADKTKVINPQLDNALQGTTLPPMLDVLPAVLDLGYLEYAADGTAPETHDDLEKLGTRARELMVNELGRLRIRLEVVENVSNSYVDGNRRGLYSNERTDLKNMVTYILQIEKTARDARRRAMELGFTGKAWEPIVADAGDLAERAQAILDFAP